MIHSVRFLLALSLAIGTLHATGPAALRVHEQGRHLETIHGQPFFYLGDTAWELFHRLDREEADIYLSTRAGQGFTVVQAVVLAEQNGLRSPNAYGDLPLLDMDPTRPNEAYFQHVDWVVNHAAELGLYVGMLPTWGDKLPSDNPGAGPLIFDKVNAFTYGKFLGERYQDAPIIWILGGDRNIQSLDVRDTWNAMARGIREAVGTNQLITFHPRGGASSFWYFHDEPWLDFNSYQSGHDQLIKAVYETATQSWMAWPPKPFIDSEPAYEDIIVRFWEYIDFSKPPAHRAPPGTTDENGRIIRPEAFPEGIIDAYSVRVHGYWTILAGAAGTTYGNNAVWQMWEPGVPVAIPCLFDWRTSLMRPGAMHMQHLRSLFESRGFGRLVPDQSLIYGQNPGGVRHLRASVTRELDLGIIYLAEGRPIQINAGKLAGPELQGWWFNPRDGTSTFLGLLNPSIHTLQPPTTGPKHDWVLVLETRGAYPAPPGTRKIQN